MFGICKPWVSDGGVRFIYQDLYVTAKILSSHGSVIRGQSRGGAAATQLWLLHIGHFSVLAGGHIPDLKPFLQWRGPMLIKLGEGKKG